jgi:hypothetical protein
MENTSFSVFSSGPHRQNRTVAVNGIPDSSGLAVIFALLEPAGLCYGRVLQVKVLVTTHTDGCPRFVHPNVTGLVSGRLHPQHLPPILLPLVRCHLEKIDLN